MLNLTSGKVIAKIVGGSFNGEIIYLSTDSNKKNEADYSISNNESDDSNSEYESESEEDTEMIGSHIEPRNGKLIPLLDIDQRTVAYIAGPSGSGKTSYAVNLIKNYQKVYPEKEFYLFSRTNYKDDPAYNGMRVQQVKIDENLLENPIDIEKELSGGSILLFDDCNTIQNDKVKKQIDKLMSDIMEVGRKLDITIIITNHLVIPNERKIARTLLNETQVLTVFPKSGTKQQISYVLKTYFGLSKDQIEYIMELPSRWVTIHKNYPMCVVFDSGAYLLN